MTPKDPKPGCYGIYIDGQGAGGSVRIIGARLSDIDGTGIHVEGVSSLTVEDLHADRVQTGVVAVNAGDILLANIEITDVDRERLAQEMLEYAKTPAPSLEGVTSLFGRWVHIGDRASELLARGWDIQQMISHIAGSL